MKTWGLPVLHPGGRCFSTFHLVSHSNWVVSPHFVACFLKLCLFSRTPFFVQAKMKQQLWQLPSLPYEWGWERAVSPEPQTLPPFLWRRAGERGVSRTTATTLRWLDLTLGVWIIIVSGSYVAQAVWSSWFLIFLPFYLPSDYSKCDLLHLYFLSL